MAARNALDRMKQQGSAKAKENRTKRKVEKNKEYGKSGLSSSDMAYINGNYKKVASNKAYGYRQGVKKGEIVRGTESDWLSDGNIRRTTKVEENKTWKNPTNKKGKQKYAILSSHKWGKANKFNEQLNTGTLDGLKTAKANQRKGKHISNALEWVKGGAKDILVDPAVDFMKGVGAIGSYGLAGFSGIAEDSGNLVKAISDPKRTYKDYSQGRSNFKENLKTNKEALDRTGFGESMATFLHDAKKRGEEETIRLLKEDGRGNEVKSYKEQIEKNKKRDTNLLNATGFAMELIAPTVVEDKVVDVVKGLGKNTVKSFKELKNGTASLATGILPEETAKLMANSKKYAGKGKTGASDDVFFSGTKGNTSIDRKLDNEFNKTVNRVKDVVKQNPKTKNISKFLDVIDEKPLKGTQRNIDGRTLNKKYTQTKDGYKPQLMREVDEVDNIPNGNVNGQYSMFGKDGSMNAYIDNVQNPYARYEKIINKYGDNIDGLAEKLDSMKSQNAVEMYNYLERKHPNLYKELVKETDDVDKLMLINDKYTINKIDENLSSTEQIKQLNENYNKFNEQRMLAEINGIDFNNPNLINSEINSVLKETRVNNKNQILKKQKPILQKLKRRENVMTENAIDKIVNIIENKKPETIQGSNARKLKFSDDIKSLSRNILDGEVDIKEFKKLKNMITGDAISKSQKIEFVNNKLFGGKRVLTRSATSKSIDSLLNSIDEVNDVKKVIDNFYETGEFLPISLSKTTREFLGIPTNKPLKITDKKIGGKTINEPEDIVNILTDAIINKSASLTDARYWEKQQLLAHKYGYEKIQYVRDEFDEITKTLKSLDKKKTTPEILAQKQELSLRRKQLKELLDNRDSDWKNLLRHLDETNFDNYISKEYPDIMKNIDLYKPKQVDVQKLSNQSEVNKNFNSVLDELAEKQARIDATKGRENVLKEAKRNLELGSDPSVTASPRSQNLLYNGDVGEWEQMTKGNTTGNIKDIPFKQYKQNYSKDLGLNYVNTKYPIQIRKEKQTLQGVRSYKPVDTAITNLEKLMNKEVALTIKGNVNSREYETLRTLVKDNVKMLNDLGVDNSVYFNHIKQLKMNLLKDGQVSKNLSGVKPMSGKVKNTTKGINPLEMAHIKINGNVVDNIDELTPDQLQWKYLMTEGAKTIDELFDAMPGNIPQRGDNIGDEIGSMLRPNKVENTPLDNIPNKTDDFVDGFEAFNARLNEEESKLIRKQIENKPEKIKKTYDKEQLQKEINLIDETYGKRDVKVYDNASDFLGETFPGVDEDGVIINKDNFGSYFKNKHIDMLNGEYTPKEGALSKFVDKLPSFDEFKKGVKENNNKLPYEDSKLYDVYKRWLNSWKKGLTVYNPGWHVQNFFQNKGQNYLALGQDALKPQTEARNILKQMNGKKAKDVNIFDKKNLKSYSSDEIGKLAQELGVIDGLGEDVRNARGIFPKFEQWVDNTPLMKTLEKNEQTARLHHFIEQIKRGNTPEEAVKSVNKYLFDYSNKSNADKVMGDFVDPFWTFHKNNAKLMYNSMYEHPSKINAIVRGTNGLETGIPEEQRQNEESKYGKIQKPYANLTDSVNKDQYNYLYKQNMFPDVEDALPFEDEALENKMNPILRMLMQQSRGEGNFGNKIVDVEEGEKPGWNEITKEQRMKEVIMDLNPFMPNLVKTLDSEKNRQQKADDEKQSQEITDKQILMDWINYITGNKGNWYRNVNFK